MWRCIAMEAHLLSPPAEGRITGTGSISSFSRSAPPCLHLSSLPPYSISFGPCQIYHIVFLTSSPGVPPLSSLPISLPPFSPISYYMVLPQRSASPAPLYIWHPREGVKFEGGCMLVFWHPPLQVGGVTDSRSEQVKQVGEAGRLLNGWQAACRDAECAAMGRQRREETALSIKHSSAQC